jgi:hypothetical protein
VQRPEPCSHAFFISHVGEDSEAVRQLAAEVAARSSRGGRPALQCFLDVFSWQIGNDALGVIKEFLLRSDCMVAWVTPAYLANARGWVWIELAYAELIEASLNPSGGDVRFPYIVPVFQGLTVAQVERTPLLRHWQRKLVLPEQGHSITGIAEKLVDFYEQEVAKGGSGGR